MIVQTGRLNYGVVGPREWKFFTGNSYINKEGGLVMGRGAALSVKSKYAGIDKAFGELVRKNLNSADEYYLAWLRPPGIGVFQVKRNFKDKADLELIATSASVLNTFASEYKNYKIHVNFPGIGYGGLRYSEVHAVLRKECPQDNITFWKVSAS